ncbi:MAG: hypothetical protein OXG72_13175 [Acidobacteria bacterium]|nr:hypothetical protein [Acidobacteriota bacterium]
MNANRPHYHAWLMASTGRMFYKCRAFHTRQVASMWAKRRQPDPERRMVIACTLPECRPALD